MKTRPRKGLTIGSLLGIVAVSALVANHFRPPDPPDEGEAIRVAREKLTRGHEFEYPDGYVMRTVWDPVSTSWRVGFRPVDRGRGYTFLMRVSRDRSCRSMPMDFDFFRRR